MTQTTPVTLDDWISSLPIKVQEVIRSQIFAAHQMATAFERYFPTATSYDTGQHEKMREALAAWKETQSTRPS